jgi:hypothetical protein
MRQFKVLLRHASDGGTTLEYDVVTRTPCRAGVLAKQLLQEAGYAAADIFERGALLGTVTLGG